MFLVPFEKCDSKGEYLLDKKDVEKCLEEKELEGLGLKKDNVTLLF